MSKVSVILPVYNGEAFLKEAIDSILHQTFKDFELIIINDGSTDSSEQIIKSYSDNRIVYIKNEKNEGLIFTLNKAIYAANGKYIARMDADDVALPVRFEKQVEYLDANPEFVMLATCVILIDANGNRLSDWKEDITHLTYREIKDYLPVNNCLAHPSIMGLAHVFKKYKYRFNQKYSEDYDLWLRVTADKLKIEKLGEQYLQHRILPTSATRFKKVNVYYRIAKVKMRFFKQQLSKGNINGFVLKVFVFGIGDFVKGTGKQIKAIFRKNEIQASAA